MTNLINIGLSFLEGFALILSPCILPILPIILAGSLEGSKKRPIGIVVGFVLAFALFTFFSRLIVRYSGIDLSLIRYISYALLFLFGLIMLSTSLTDRFASLTRGLAKTGTSLTTVNDSQGGFMSGVVFGGLVGLIWTPCAGPILAAVIVLTVIQQTTFNSFLIVLAFGLGAAIPMLMIALFGRAIASNFDFIKQRTVLFRKLLGFIIIASVVYMLTSESFIFSSSKPVPNQTQSSSNLQLINGLLIPYPAPPISGISAWINSMPLELSALKGKVVLIDFWTYSCINCIRTLPYLSDWYAKYHDKGFEIIGVHSPEFEFEKDINNVKKAVAEYAIAYPVALDNHFATWRNYNNIYWPAHYLINKKGDVVYQQFGEGNDDVTENNIRYLLGLNESVASTPAEQTKIFSSETPETYLGYTRQSNYAGSAITRNKPVNYTFPAELSTNEWALQGTWTVAADRIISGQANAALKLHFHARKVFIVTGSAIGSPINVTLLLNGKPVTNEKGVDVVNGKVTIKNHRLYELIVLPESSSGIIELTASAPGLEIYTFTFGS